MAASREGELVNEAVERILLDVVVRGHGDRLIGRWSREPHVQRFVEQVPYLLDRINQLHLACSRRDEPSEDATRHLHNHHHHHHHHHHHFHHRHSETAVATRSSLHDFVGLISAGQLHWLVRTRDPLGLTPLHKAVLFDNRPIAEYIIDRYADELAPNAAARASGCGAPVRLIDAQDKYGRTALHYAAAGAAAGDAGHEQQHASPAANTQLSLYRLLLAKGADADVRDFRGKRPRDYLRRPQQLRARNVVHLANKLSANYQANVLSKTLRATSGRGCAAPLGADLVGESENDSDGDDYGELRDAAAPQAAQNRESMSLSCADLSAATSAPRAESAREHEPQRRRRSLTGGGRSSEQANGADDSQQLVDALVPLAAAAPRKPPQHQNKDTCDILTQDEEEEAEDDDDLKLALKRIVQERCRGPILDSKRKLAIRRCLNDGVVERAEQLVLEGFGQYLVDEAPLACWSQHCKRYVSKIVPKLLEQVDTLHEFVASNQVLAFREMLASKPILTRVQRPYKRATMNALHLAVHLNRRTIVRFLLDKFPELVSARDSSGATCLHLAAKSLRCEQVYFALADLFGSQLEQLRDSKNKTAADYRRQAIKLASLDLHHQNSVGSSSYQPNNCQKTKLDSNDEQHNAKVLLSRNNLMENKLKLEGVGVSLATRQQPPPRWTPTSRNQRDQRLDTSSASCVDQTPFTSRQSSRASKSSDNSTESLPDGNSAAPSQVGPEEPNAVSGEVEEEDAAAAILGDEDNSNGPLIEELAQLDAAELMAVAPTGKDERPAPPQAAAPTARKLDELISSCIGADDFKRLEHLILAGCGQRILSAYARRLAAAAGGAATQSADEQISERMRAFVERHVRAAVETNEHIHYCLQRCYATRVAPLDNNVDCDAGAVSDPIGHENNATFYKLCNLFETRKGLIMARDKFGASPLHVALIRSDKRLLDYLLRRFPDVSVPSAPDHENRNALHYAAIVLAAFGRHGELWLARAPPSAGGAEPPAAYWPVGVVARQVYENLLARYGLELCEARDKHGKRCSDYLVSAPEHTDLTAGEWLPAAALGGCCQEYARLLERYGYIICKPRVAPNEAEPEEASAHELGESRSAAAMEMDEQPISRAQSGVTQADCDTSSRAPSVEDGAVCEQLIVPVLQAAAQAEHERGTGSSEIRPVGQVTPVLGEGEQTLIGRVVGCDESNQTLAKQRVSPRGAGGGKRVQRRGRPLDKSQAVPPLPSPGGADSQKQQLHRRLSRHRHHSHHRHKRHPLGPSSIVGGVIVPTIIHNDKMDEIETYDIIYRQPAQHLASGATSSCSSTGSLTDLEGEMRLESSPARRIATPLETQAKSSGGGGDSDSGEQDDDEELEEAAKLSSEFEDRVRREKSELRAKVDQIMREIKSSAKSGKSSRFLASPNDLAALDCKQPEPAETSAVQIVQVAHVAPGKQRPPNETTKKKKKKSFSSSGRSSAQTDSQDELSRSQSPTATSKSSCSSSGSLAVRSAAAAAAEPKQRTSSSSSTCSSASSCSTSSSSASTSSSLIVANNVEVDKQHLAVVSNGQFSAASEQQVDRSETSGGGDPLSNRQLFSKNTYGQTYLHFIASKAQSASSFYKVIEHGSQLIGERDIFYRTARDVALQFNLPNNVQTLDKYIIDLFVGAKTSLLWLMLNQGYTPLIHVSDPDGNDIMLILKLLKLDRMIHYLLRMADFQRWRDELHTFIRHSYSAGVSELIKKHKHLVGAKSVHARTSLHLAVLFDRPNMVEELLLADPTCVRATDNMGRTPLHYSYGLQHMENSEQIRDKLLAAGANIEARDVRMRTPKYYFVFKREIEEIRRIELELN